MYMIEGQRPGTSFNNIPNSIYWSIVTMTTVGYGDITPETPLGDVYKRQAVFRWRFPISHEGTGKRDSAVGSLAQGDKPNGSHLRCV